MSNASTNSKHILVVTDNPVLLDAFQQCASNLERHRFQYAYSFNNKNPELLVLKGCYALNVKAKASSISDEFDIVFSIHCKQIFPPELVNTVRCINLHPGLNPYNRGWFPQVFCILNGMPAGATLHEMIEDIDGGPVIAQKEIELYSYDTSLTAYNRIQQAEVEILENWLEQVIEGNYTAKETGDGNYNGIRDFKSLCQIDPKETGTFGDFIDRLRALSHPPYANAYFLDTDDKRVYLNIELNKENG